MKTKLSVALLLIAILGLCVAGTKISRLTQTQSIQSNSLFVVVTGTTTKVTRFIEADDLAAGLGPWITNVIGAGSGDAGGTNARQFGSASLTNLSGNPNVVTQILAGANITVTSNNAGVFTIAGSAGGGDAGGTNARIAAMNGTATNTTFRNITNTGFTQLDGIVNTSSSFTNSGLSTLNGLTVQGALTSQGAANAFAQDVTFNGITVFPTLATNMWLRLDGQGRLATGKIDSATIAISADGTLSATGTGDAGGTNARQFGSSVLSNLVLTVSDNVTNINERNKVYVRTNGSDSTGIRGRIDWPFLTLTGAKAAAVYGDTVMVGPGLYSANNTNLLKGGVNWFFDTGAVISNRVQQAGDDFWIGIFDDRFSGAVTSTVAGNLKVIWDMTDYDLGGVNVNTLGPVVITNAGSEMTFRAKSMETWATDAANVGLGGMYIVNCRQFFVDVDEFYAPGYGEDDGILVAAAAMYWERGNVFGRIGRIHTEGYGVWANQPIDGKGTTNDLYLLGDLWETTAQSAIYTSMSNTTHRAWFRVAELRTSFGGFSTISLYNGGRVYVDSLKISGRSQNTTILADRDGTIYAGVEGWVTAQKISGDSKWVLNNNGNLYVTAQQYEDTGSDATDKLFDLQGGYARLIGGHAKAFANGIWQAGGTNVIDGLRMDSGAVANVTNVPLTYKGGLLTVKDVTLTATNNAANAVNAVAAQTLTVEGYLNANKIIDSDVTIAGTSTNTLSVLHMPNLATNGFLQVGPGGIVRTGAIGANLSVAADGTLSATASGSGSTTNIAAMSLNPAPLFVLNTNSFASGTNTLYTNVFNSVTAGLTNVYVTNIFDGQTIQMWLFPSNGVTVAFPQFASTDHIDGSTVTPATNIWSWVQITRRGTLTNILVQTATYALEAGTGTTFTTNFASRTITITGSDAGGTNSRQGGSLTLTNLSGTGAITNIYSLSLSNSTMAPIVRGTVGANIAPTNTTGALYGLEQGANITLTPNGSNIVIASTAVGGGGTNFSSIIVTNQIIHEEELFTASNAIVAFDFQGTGKTRYVANSNIVNDVTYTLTNPAYGRTIDVFLIGQTNGATNHTVTIAATGGASINWKTGTNGSYAFILYSNATAALRFKSYITATSTNIDAEWSQDSFWPQPNAPVYASAGGSISNFFPAGLLYYDYAAAINAYTNHNSTGLNYTNLSCVTIPAHTLTNLGDSITGVWRGRIGPNGRTNQYIVGFGTATNIFDTGQFTNSIGHRWELTCEITCISPTNQSIYSKFEISGTSTLVNGFTNALVTAPLITITNGATNVFRLQGRAFGAFGATNEFFKVSYQPGVR